MTTIPPTAPAIAFLGTGRMGGPMAANLAHGGFGVRVWNRTISRAAALAADGAVVASSPAEAVRGAEIVDLLQSTPLGAPYAVQKARSMLAGDFSPAFALKHALKDAELAAQAAQASGATLTLTSALLPRWRDTAASGHADDDLSAVYLTT